MNWYLMPQLLGTRTRLAGTSEALDSFPGWNGLYWGSAPIEDMVLDFDEPDGTSCYWRDADRLRSSHDLLQLGEYKASKILYSFVSERLCSIGFSMSTAWDTEGVYVALLAAYGEPDNFDSTNGTYAWNGARIACRLRMKSDTGGSVAWFHVPLTRAVVRR